MAEAFLPILIDNLSSLIQGEIGLIMGVDSEMKKLSSTLTTIQAVLEDAEEKQLHDKAIRNWLRKLNDLSYEIDDILDECATEVAKLEYRRRRSTVFNMNKIVKKILYQRKIGRRMKQVTEKLDIVATEREKFHLRETTIVLQRKVPTTRETGSMLNEPHYVYGRDDEKEKIVDVLVNQVGDRQELSILPIIGIGGLGKTTLAQLVFKDNRVADHFDVKFWVCVSDNFDLKTLIKAMIESITRGGNGSNLVHLDSLQQSLWELLNQKRYLLVLDDVWNDNQEKWSMLKDLLACGSTGSSIIVTTRLKTVADIMATVPACFLKPLSEKECWLLFKQRAFAKDERVHANLYDIGEQIVKKCAGVPLAAKALGGLLRFKRKEEDWILVKESELWNMPQEENLILPSLRLSYNHLPSALRQCFAYFAIFPKDSYIDKAEVILQWIAHGFISSNETFEVEDIGNEIFNELVLRSLLEKVRIHHPFGPSFQMHDLIHDLAQSVAENKVPGTRVETENMQICKGKIRQVVLQNKLVAFPTSTFLDMDLSSVLANFGRLRVLHAGYIQTGKIYPARNNEIYTRLTEVPRDIGCLKHLRYLNLSKTEIISLPDSLCSLWNLKILNLNLCQKLTYLPKTMWKLYNLRHLFLERCYKLEEMPPKIGELASLKTLSMFVVGHEKGNQLGELELLNLGGRLHVKNLERVQEKHFDANKANLAGKKNLRDLCLSWNSDNSSKLLEANDERVLEALEFHANLRKLTIVRFRGKNFPFWMRSSTLENLVSFAIENCPHCSSLPQALGELPHLKRLSLADLPVEYIVEDGVQDFNGLTPKFPVLELLILYRLPYQKGLLKKEAEKAFPNLQRLYVTDCSLLSLPQLSSVECLYCSGMNLTTFNKLDNITWLYVTFNKKVTCVPKECQENLTGLIETLCICEAGENSLTEEWLQGLKSLAKLIIVRSDTLLSVPDTWFSYLSALKELKLENCSELVEISENIKYLPNLTRVTIENLPKMVSVPNALQHVSTLRFLALYRLQELSSLPDWLQNVTSLDTLYIDDCPKLKSFPDSIQQSKLKHLGVMRCPELERRCEKEKGEDWHKIAHIRYLLIGFPNPLRDYYYEQPINIGFEE